MTFAVPPEPGQAGTLEDLVRLLRLLKIWAGDPSYERITSRVNATWVAAGRPASEMTGRTTVLDCFRPGRRRLNAELVVAVVAALHPDTGYVAQWRQALQVVGGRARAAAQVRVQDVLPPDLAGFTGRTAELARLRRALRPGAGGAVVISAIAGMAGVGKTRLAVHAGHLLVDEKSVDRVLFVNLRGFHPDLAQPPADPAAVLDGFLRLLGVPGQQLPHTLPARTAAYRGRLAGTRTLVVLDNAADADQVRPLLPDTAGCPVLITSRRDLIDLRPATHLTVDAFTPEEALRFLAEVAPHSAAGPDPTAAARIVGRCGYLPLALGLVAAHIRARPGWTLTDHADRLDDRHRHGRLDTGVELALDLSYQQLRPDERRLLRLAVLHPGQDLDAHAVAAVAGTDLATAEAHVGRLCRNHLLQPAAPGRYTFHDLVRIHAAGRAGDEDPPHERRAALTRLVDFYLATAAAAMDALYPAEAHRRPRIPPPGTPVPALPDPDTARAWLDTERPTLVAVAIFTADNGWPAHTTRLSAILFRYLAGGHSAEALAVHGHAVHAAHRTGDPAAQAHALTGLGTTHMQMGRYGLAAEHLRQARDLFRRAGDGTGEARALTNLGVVEERLGHYRRAADHHARARDLFRRTGDGTGEARTYANLGVVDLRLRRYRSAADHYELALDLYRRADHREGEANALNGLGDAEGRLGRYGPAAEHQRQALALYRQLGNRTGEAWTLDSIGTLHVLVDQPAMAIDHYRQALTIFRETGERQGEACTLNGLGEAAHGIGRPADAITHHTAALTIAADIDARDQLARAHTGLGRAHSALNNHVDAERNHRHALALYADLGMD
jgi:tetratricopeptide (TPR) repeat protein